MLTAGLPQTVTRDVAVAVVVHSASHFSDLVNELLPSWKQGADGVRTSLYLVNNNCPAWDDDMLSQFPETTVIEQPRQQGLSRNLNAALQRSSNHELFLALNPDTRLAPQNLELMTRYMREHPNCGLGTCKLLSFSGGLQHNCRRWQSARIAAARRLPWFPASQRIIERYLMIDEAYNREATPDWVSGCYMFFRQPLLTKLGGFDEGFRLYFEDCDIARRIKDSGYSVNFTPEPVCNHREHRQSMSLLSWHGRTHLRSWLRFKYKCMVVYGKSPSRCPVEKG